jgi:3-methyladenine DNA glycosylase AlkC
MSDLYETDILVWSEQQAELLRRLAHGERVNDQLDWEHLIEEVESAGSEQLHAVESLLLQALVHMLKAQGWPLARDVENWRADARGFRAQAANRFAPSMRQRLDLALIYRQALRAVPATMDGQPPQPLPDACPATLDELLGDAL